MARLNTLFCYKCKTLFVLGLLIGSVFFWVMPTLLVGMTILELLNKIGVNSP